ncbi:MAG: hypothetical protein LUG52_00530 [Clostridia bacterium]|nr:hypothetical protein [Clostridia bacterium]
MAVLAMPKKNSYIVKKSSASKIINSKNSPDDIAAIRESAYKFAANNLRKNTEH